MKYLLGGIEQMDLDKVTEKLVAMGYNLNVNRKNGDVELTVFLDNFIEDDVMWALGTENTLRSYTISKV